MLNPEPPLPEADTPRRLGMWGARFACAAAVWAGRVKALSGWRRFAAAFAGGVVSVAAMPPLKLWPVLFVTLPILIWLIDGALAPAHKLGREPATAGSSWRQLGAAAAVGWWFGFGYFVAGLYWVGEALLVEADTFAVLIPFAVTLLPAGLALFWGMAAALALPCWRTGPWRVLALALALSAMEWARGHVFTGFPWNALGYALTHPLSLLQTAALVGVWGLTLSAVLVLAAPLVLVAAAPPGAAGRKQRWLALAIAVGPVLVATLWGQWRLAAMPASTVAGVKFRLVQPSVPQREKWRPENQERIFLQHLDLSGRGGDGEVDGLAGVTHLVWPEASMPFLPADHPAARAAIGRLLPAQTLLLAGALRAETAAAAPGRRVFNSLLVFGAGGSLIGHYDKVHLVPFGEYLPFQAALEAIGLEQLTRRRGGFASGPTPRPLLKLPGLPPLAPLICYEVIFPGAVVAAEQRPGLLLNLTNDGWFGDSSGPRQHFQQARVRAVEEGLPLLRVANNGISAMIDGNGRVLALLGLDQRGSADSPLPAALPATPYARFGDAIFAALWLLGAAALAAAGWRQPRGR